MKHILATLGFCLSLLSSGQDYRATIDSIMQAEVAEDDPALFVGVVHDGEIVYERIRGFADLQHNVPAHETSRTNIASNAKQYTALMVLDLAQKGQLSLENDIRKYLPELYPNVADTIRIRHLLNHTSGVRDYCDMMGIQQNPWWRREGLDNRDVLEFHRKQSNLAFEPGSRYSYSNSGYVLLALIIEEVTGEEFHAYATQFFEDLGMTNTAFPKSYMRIIPNLALPYSNWGGADWLQYPMMTSTAGEGFLFTTLHDQLIYEQMIQKSYASNNELLIQSQQTIPNSEVNSYGYGLFLTDRFNRKCIHHAGSTGSYGAQFYRFPEENLSVVVLSNNGSVWTEGVANQVAELYLKDVELEINYADGMDTLSTEPLTSSFFAQYYSPSGRLMRIVEEEGRILWKNGNSNGIELNREDENLFHPYYDVNMKIGFAENGAVLFETDGTTTFYRKLSEQEARPTEYSRLVGIYESASLDVEFELLQEDGQLKLKMPKWDEAREVSVFNQHDLMIADYRMKIERDAFNRVVALTVSKGRALNNRFNKRTNLQFHPTAITDRGSISVTTIGAVDGSASNILLTENYPNGNEIWSKQYGGTSYDKAHSVFALEDGYLIVGSTSSYGVGNYDFFVIRTDKNGKLVWQNTYGREMNDYAYTAEITPSGYVIKGTTQDCNDDVFDCTTYVWEVNIDLDGNKLSSSRADAIETNL
ncbi:serine hydrolase domain-containing protein [Phaeocystidibacter luteus]|uniref:Beta-lactamase family protein n=1 Tax=Phaeocystidibacter luteus TaxID=911197 RepID=A0A6N6RDP3_9FLAO|nr:serine hydrolase domain-containing protein [Phaeocystidibacter luteus]KAB2807350.1 beta-lactamase family protein [Phaeocystidibacter luteus]